MISFPFTANPVLNEAGIITGYDRATNTVDNRRYNGLLYTDGVDIRYANAFKVVSDTGMVTKVIGTVSSTEIAWAKVGNAYAYEPTASRSFTHDAADLILNRIDRIILRRDDTTAVRKVDLYLLKGTPASTPVAPALVRTETIHDLVLADIYIGANATAITNDNITDHRLNEDLCGVFKSTFDIQELINLKYIEHTTAPITYYVSPTGSNTNNGLTVGTPFATVAYALSKLPKYIGHTVTINFAAGTYTEDKIVCSGFIGNGKLILFASNSSSDAYFLQKGIKLEKNSCNILLSGLSASSSDSVNGTAFQADNNPGFVEFFHCQSSNLTGATRDGFSCSASPSVICDNCWARYHYAAFVVGDGGYMLVTDSSAGYSDCAFYCFSSFMIVTDTNSTSNTVREIILKGGVIARTSGAILGTY